MPDLCITCCYATVQKTGSVCQNVYNFLHWSRYPAWVLRTLIPLSFSPVCMKWKRYVKFVVIDVPLSLNTPMGHKLGYLYEYFYTVLHLTFLLSLNLIDLKSSQEVSNTNKLLNIWNCIKNLPLHENRFIFFILIYKP